MLDEHDQTLGLLCDQLDMLEAMRIAQANRMQAATSKGEWFGKNMPADNPYVAEGYDVLAELKGLEKRTVKNLERAMKAHPLGSWVQSPAAKAVGLKSVARLLACVGNPAWHPLEQRPRTFGQLRAYCGVHVVNGRAPRRKKGQQSNWDGGARKQLWLIAESCLKNMGSPYRAVYDRAREKADGKVHTYQCQNTVRPGSGRKSNGCGTQAHPEWGAPGTPFRDGHKHAYGMRAIMVAVLRDLWREARRVYGLTDESDVPQVEQLAA